MKKVFFLFLIIIITIGCSNTESEKSTTNIQKNQKSDKQMVIPTPNLEKSKIIGDSEEIIEVQVQGVGAVQESNHAKARDEALWDAQRRAVEVGIGSFLSSETLVQNAQLIEDNIYTQVNGFVKDYEIESENNDDYLYYITINAKVQKINLGNELFLIGLIKKVGDPRVMVVIPEYFNNQEVTSPSAETAVIKHFVDAGYRVVDQSQVEKIRYSEEARLLAEGDAESAAHVARQYNADILITGKATSVGNEKIQGLNSSTGILEIRGIKVDTGEVVFAESIQAAGVDLTEEIAAKKALQKAGEIASNGGLELGGKTVEPIIQKLASAILKKPSIQIVLTNSNNEIYNDLVEKLKVERTVQNVFAREFSGNIGRVDVDYDRGVSDLQNLIKEIVLVPFEFTGVTTNTITMKMIKPKSIVLNNTKNFQNFNSLISFLETIEDIVINSRNYSQEDSKVEIITNRNLFDIADSLAKNYNISRIDNDIIVLE